MFKKIANWWRNRNAFPVKYSKDGLTMAPSSENDILMVPSRFNNPAEREQFAYAALKAGAVPIVGHCEHEALEKLRAFEQENKKNP